MKRFLLYLLTLTLLFAASGFWETVIEIEKRFYQPKGQKPALTKEVNATKELEKLDAASMVDERVSMFNQLISSLKEKPYDVNRPDNPFFNPSEAGREHAKLVARIGVNREYGYDAAVTRDKIALKVLETKEHIYRFFVRLAREWTSMDDKSLKSAIEEELIYLKSVETGKFKIAYEKASASKDKISAEIVRNYLELEMHTSFYGDFLNYLRSNPSLLHYRSLTAMFKLDEIIEKLNGIELFAKLNTYLRYIHLDMGRIIIFFLIMLFAWGASFVIYYRLYSFLKMQILKKRDRIDELLLANLDGIRKPLYLLVLAFGFELGLEVLLYPKPMAESVGLLFYAFYLSIGAYISIVVIDSLFFDYLVKHGELKNRQMRQELINLVLSVLKITVVMIAIFMLLVKMGVNITGLLASLGIGGLAIALAAQNTLSNFFGLLKIIFDNSFSQGDWIETKDIEGTVVEIGFISTFIRTFDNALITVPNATLANTPLKNWSKRTVGRRIKMYIGVTYGSKRENLTKALEEIKEMLIAHPGIATPQKIDTGVIKRRSKREKKLISAEDKYGVKTTLLVYLDEFADSSVNILIYSFTKTVKWEEWLEIKQDVLLKIWEILDRNGLEFAFPSESLYFDPENIEKSFKNIAEKAGNSTEIQS
ncbi:mechanosensitive ion channel [Hydrogenimonas sp.]|nr:mechanosensitive ion channel [Hydrogenimonas sp.]